MLLRTLATAPLGFSVVPAMDPPDPTPDDHCACLEAGFRKIIASQPSCKPTQSDLRFVKCVEAPEVKLYSSTTSKFKVVALDFGPPLVPSRYGLTRIGFLLFEVRYNKTFVVEFFLYSCLKKRRPGSHL